MNKYFFPLIFLIISSNVFAASKSDYFEVDYVRVDKSGKGYVSLKTPLISGNSEGILTCAPKYPNALAFDTNTDGGRSIYSLALAAKMSGSKIYALSTESCSIYGVMADWNWGFVK